MVAGMELAREIAACEPVRSTVTRELKPGPDVIGREELEAALRERVELIYHPVGTCAMGSVVDSELRVHGLEALRVVDASVMPAIPGGNTNAPTIGSPSGRPTDPRPRPGHPASQPRPRRAADRAHAAPDARRCAGWPARGRPSRGS